MVRWNLERGVWYVPAASMVASEISMTVSEKGSEPLVKII